jgi:hypothetical protein
MTHDQVHLRCHTQLTQIPDLYAQAHMALTPGNIPSDDTRHATSNPSRPTVRLDIVDLLDTRLTKTNSDEPGTRDPELDRKANARRLGILGTLWLWVTLIDCELADSNQPVQPPNDNIASVCSWLITHLNWTLDMHPDIANDIDWMHRDLQHATGNTPPKPVPCRNCGGHVNGHDNNSWYQCSGCGQSWIADAELVRIGATATRMMTLRQLAAVLEIPLKTLKNAAGTRFLPTGRNTHGTNLYDIDTVRRAQETATTNSRAGRAGRRHRACK